MRKQTAFCLAVLIGLTASAQTINLSGIVSNSTNQPVANAIVTLVRQGMKDTTAADGKYSFSGTVGIKLPAIVPQTREISINNGVLQFTLNNSSPVKIEVFNPKGILLKKELLPNTAAGVYRFNIEKNLQATNLLVVKASIGKDEMSFRYMPLNSGKFTLNRSGEYSSSVGGGLAKMAAVVDTLIAKATGFQTKTVAISSYDNQQQNITLDSSKGNAPAGSVGCGKDLSTLTGGYYKITSASLNRTYNIYIPTNYDKNNPYRLIFCMHCMGSSDTGVVNGNFYGLKTLAANAKIPCIFVAPQGYTDGSPWRGGDNKDHILVDDLLALIKGNLCVDTTRIFCCGFSFGAMVSYSLSMDHQKQFRAVATYAPANYNIYIPPNPSTDPIAYYQTTGTTDGTCPWISSDAQKRGGKYCLLQHLQDNGCTVPSTIPLATSNKHVSTEFSGCKDGYPVKFGSFVGGHTDNNTDAGSSGNWIYSETWEFFTRF